MKTTIRTTVPLLAHLLLALKNRQQPFVQPHRPSLLLVHGNVRPALEEEAPVEVRSIWQRDAYWR